MRVIFGTGVLAKDGKTPWADNTMHVLDREGWLKPVTLSWHNMAVAMKEDSIVEIQVIDEHNKEYTFVKESVKERVLHFYPDADSKLTKVGGVGEERVWNIYDKSGSRTVLGSASSPTSAWRAALDNIQRERRGT